MILILVSIVFLSCKEKIVIKPEDDADTVLEKGYEAFDLGYYDRAIEIYEYLLANFSEERHHCAWAVYEIGMIHVYKKEYKIAYEYFEQVINEYPEHSAQNKLAKKWIKRIKTGDVKKNSSYEDIY